jgi:predicted nucleotidyltransferase
MHPLIQQHSEDILRLAHQRGVHHVRLFGSMVRNQAHKDSDVDLLVELSPESSGFALGGFLHDVSELLGRKVDVVTENALHPRIRQQVLKEAQPL